MTETPRSQTPSSQTPRSQTPRSQTPSSSTPASTSHLVWRTGLAVAVIALALNLLIFVLARAFGSPLSARVGTAEMPIALIQVIALTIFPVALATLLLWLLHRRVAKIWTILAYVGAGFALLSLVGPLTQATTGGSKLALALMHVVTGAVWCVLLLRAQRAISTR